MPPETLNFTIRRAGPIKAFYSLAYYKRTHGCTSTIVVSTLQIECFSLFFAETRVCDMSTDYWSVLVTLDQFGLSFEWMYQSNEFRFIQL